eukprot:1154661-Pelagomonas_calceolata.AAC.2
MGSMQRWKTSESSDRKNDLAVTRYGIKLPVAAAYNQNRNMCLRNDDDDDDDDDDDEMMTENAHGIFQSMSVLRQAVLDSHQRGYHKGPAPWVCLDTSHCSTQKDALNLQREAVNALRGSAYKAQNCKAFEAWDPNALPIIAGPEADALW